MNFLVLVLALIAQHLSNSGGTADFIPHGYVNLFNQDGPLGRLGTKATLLLWLVIPFLLAAAVHLYLLDSYVGMFVLATLFALLVFFTLGYSDCRKAINPPDNWHSTHLVPALASDASNADRHAFAALATLRCVMTPLFWIFVLGAYGALLLLLLYTFTRFFPQHTVSRRWICVLEWLPARLLVLGYCIDCRFSSSWRAIRFFASLDRSEALITGFAVPNVLEQVNLKRNNPGTLLARQIVSWLAIMALVTLIITFY